MSCLYYRDILDDQRIRRAYGVPVGIRRDGLIGAEGLVCRNPCSEVWIPHYLLVGRAKEIFAEMRDRQARGLSFVATKEELRVGD